MNLAKVAKGVSFHSSRTDMQMARLDGDLTMESGDLRANAIAGPMHLATRAKDIHLDDVSGILKIDNSNGMVEYRAGKGQGDVEINNQRGTVQVTLPKDGCVPGGRAHQPRRHRERLSIHPGPDGDAIRSTPAVRWAAAGRR